MAVLPYLPWPKRRRTACEVVSVLAGAMGYRAPAGEDRVLASDVASSDEVAAATALYAEIGDEVARQAILDVMVAINSVR